MKICYRKTITRQSRDNTGSITRPNINETN